MRVRINTDTRHEIVAALTDRCEAAGVENTANLPQGVIAEEILFVLQDGAVFPPDIAGEAAEWLARVQFDDLACERY